MEDKSEYIPKSRAQRRREERFNKDKQKAQSQTLSVLAKEYKLLAETIVDGYQTRLNEYLKKVSKPMLQNIGYDNVALTLNTVWQKPTKEIIDYIKAKTKIVLDPEEEILHAGLLRAHFTGKEPANENDPNSTFSVWGTLHHGLTQDGQKVSKHEAEVQVYTSFIGFMAEKGIEYMEAERQTQKQQYDAAALDAAKQKVEETQKIFEDAINSKPDKEPEGG